MTHSREATAAVGAEARNSPSVDLALAARLFGELHQRTSTDPGYTRPSYGLGEQIAHDMVHREARRLGLATHLDAGCNLYMVLKGEEEGPGIVIGSHLDSVPCGGNFDGAAGVLMGLAVVSGFVKAGVRPKRDITIMAIRAEESAWFAGSYVGSKLAFGLLPPSDIDGLRRSSDRITLGRAIDASGGDTTRLKAGEAFLSAENVGLYIEPHIEQGPILVDRGIPTGIVTGIRGSFRYRQASCRGHYAHSGATPHESRADAVSAAATLVVRLNEAWERARRDGDDLVVTFSQFSTDPSEAAFSKIAGLVSFSLDVRSEDQGVLDRMSDIVGLEAARIEQEQNVTFDFGPKTTSTPALMHPSVVRALEDCADSLGIARLTMPCGAGHDAAVFANQGIPVGMIFIRNANGSHNPQESMEMADFAAAAEILSAYCLTDPVPVC